MKNIIIIGAGLSGLYLAYLLKKEGLNPKLIEARDRLGGRIFSKYNAHQKSPIELGATWLWKYQSKLLSLLQDLDLHIFPQKMDNYAIYQASQDMPAQLFQIPPQEPSFRIVGGTGKIIEALAKNLDHNQIHLSEVVKNISSKDNFLCVETNQTQYQGTYVVSTLPPQLLVGQIEFEPNLPQNFINIAKQTHTWMGESIKVGLRYETTFWRVKTKTSTIFSQAGPITEMYDHSDFENKYFALKGFVNPIYAQVTSKERKELIIKQLIALLGEKAGNFLSYEEAVWSKENFTFKESGLYLAPHQNNGHQVFQESYLNNRFFMAGAETAEESPGYMLGAIHSAETTFNRLIQHIQTQQS